MNVDLITYMKRMSRPDTPAILILRNGQIHLGVLAYSPEFPDWLYEPIPLDNTGLTLNQLVVGSNPTGGTEEPTHNLTLDQSLNPNDPTEGA